MYVLHAHWQPPTTPTDAGNVLFWAETATVPPLKTDRRTRKAQLHPFCASEKSLRQLLRDLMAFDGSGQSGATTLLLPTGKHAPQPSPHLVQDWAFDERTAPTLSPWQVTGLWLTPALAFAVLNDLPAAQELPHQIRLGDDVRFWEVVTNLALEALAQQKIAPALLQVPLQRQNQGYFAHWSPVLDGPRDVPRLARLVAAMPPLCRAETDDAHGAPSPRLLLDTFLNTMVDTLARQWGQPKQPGFTFQQNEPAHHWLRALFQSDVQIKGVAAQLQRLYTSYGAWLRNLHMAGDRQFRVAFRLEAPLQQEAEGTSKSKRKNADWMLHFLLQARDDPSLLAPAELVWQTRGTMLNALNRRFDNPQEKLLAGLGYAARLYAPLRRGLQGARPTAATLSAQEAFTFLRESAPLLEESGFGVLVPPWWNKPGTRLGVRLHMKGSSKSGADAVGTQGMTFENLVSYRWELSLGDTTLTRAEFDALVALKSPLVQIRGQWVQLDPEQVEAAIRFWQKHEAEADVTLQEALQLGLGAESMGGLAVENVEYEGWLADWMTRFTRNEQLTPLPQPTSLRAQLRPYQQYGYSWLDFLRRWGMGACLADDMGLGKCVAPDSLVFINGTTRTIQEIWDTFAANPEFDGEGFWAIPTETLKVNAINEKSGLIVTTPVRRIYRQYVREKLRVIKLKDGSTITVTRRHQLLTNNGWSSHLQGGNYICVPGRLDWDGPPADPDLMKFIAWQIAEGYEQKGLGALSITQKNEECLQELREVLQRIGQKYDLKVNRPAIRAFPGRTPALYISSQAYRQFLEARGYAWGKLSAQKSIPPFVMQADAESVRLFLRHYFDAEASVVMRMQSIEISTASPLLIQQLSTLLRRFGIWLRISAKQKRATNGNGIYRTYQIGTLGGNSARRFFQEIGFGVPEKQQRLEAICTTENNTNVEGIPASDAVAQVVKLARLPVRHFGMHTTVYLDGSQQFSRIGLARVLTHVERIVSGEAELAYRQQKPSKWTDQTLTAYADLDIPQLSLTKQHLERLLNQEVFYCQIKAIEEIEYEGWVYDLEVAEHHNFVANNILCHNTIQTLAMLLHEKEEQQGQLPGPVLLIAPTSVVTNWAKEVERFAPDLRAFVHQGMNRLRGDAFAEAVEQAELVLTSYPLVRRDEEMLNEVEWFGVILDEAQNIKNAETKQAQAIRKFPAQFRLALTGTPVENRLSELWSILHFLNPGFLGSRQNFRQRFAIPIERYEDAEAAEQLRRLVSPFILRRVKTDPTVIQDLPDKQETKVYCNLSAEQATLYEAVVREALQQIENAEDDMQRRGQVLAMLMKLKQICNHPAQFLHQIGDGYTPNGDENRSGKLVRLLELLEETLAVGDRLLIFTQFAEMGQLLRSYLQERLGVATQFLHGGTPTRQRTAMVERFQEDADGPPIFILSLKAGGVGLNLTRANHVFHFDRWWNPAVENQATDRAFRIGQQRNVQVHKFVCVGTLEEKIDEMIERKKALAESVIGSGEGWLTELSTNELRAMVTLRRETLE